MSRFLNSDKTGSQEDSFPQRRVLLSLILLWILIAASYASSLHTPFQSDDERNITANSLVWSFDNFSKASIFQYRLVTFLSFALNYHWGQLDPFDYHLFNLIVHIINTLLVFCLSYLVLSKGARFENKKASGIAIITSFLFGLHPVHTEAVTYISGRPNSFSALFYLAGVLLFVLGSLKKTSLHSLKSIICYVIAWACFLSSFLSKEVGISFPVVCLLFDVCFMRPGIWSRFYERLILFYLPLPVLGLPS